MDGILQAVDKQPFWSTVESWFVVSQRSCQNEGEKKPKQNHKKTPDKQGLFILGLRAFSGY